MANWSPDDLAAHMSPDCRKLNAHLLGLESRPKVGLTTKAAPPTEPYVAYIDQPPLAALPASITEEAFLAKVRQVARMAGWTGYHTYSSKRSDPGFPDLLLVKPGPQLGTGRLIVAELKRQSGKLTAEQHLWLDLLRHSVATLEVYTWKPADWPQIVAILTQEGPTP